MYTQKVVAVCLVVLLLSIILVLIVSAHSGETHETASEAEAHHQKDGGMRIPQILTVSALIALGALLGTYLVSRTQ